MDEEWHNSPVIPNILQEPYVSMGGYQILSWITSDKNYNRNIPSIWNGKTELMVGRSSGLYQFGKNNYTTKFKFKTSCILYVFEGDYATRNDFGGAHKYFQQQMPDGSWQQVHVEYNRPRKAWQRINYVFQPNVIYRMGNCYAPMTEWFVNSILQNLYLVDDLKIKTFLNNSWKNL